MQLIEIFKVGKHTTVAGDSIEFTQQDLELMVFSYSNGLVKAPIVKNHPIDNKPVYGWVDKLNVNNGSLIAHVSNLDPTMIYEVRAGQYKYVSASFYMPMALNNPYKGAYYLRHVGVLGSMKPSVKGMRPLDFSENLSASIPLIF